MKMACPTGAISYSIQAGDTLYKIAAKYNTTYQVILTLNPGLNPNRLYIGQQICIPVTQATLQIANQPILVNGTNINTGQYPVLNYKPANAQFPYIYVPIAEFRRVGANVVWDDIKQLLTVTTDYYEKDNKIKSLQKDLEFLRRTDANQQASDITCQPEGFGTVVFTEITSQYFTLENYGKFNGDLTYLFDVGVPYTSCLESDVGAGTGYEKLSAKDKNGIWHVLYTRTYHYQRPVVVAT